MSAEVKAENASTVMVVRQGEEGPEVYCVRRHPKLRAWGGAVAFPGGKIDESDFDPMFEDWATAPHPRTAAFGESPSMTRACVVAAVRECFEEVRLLPVVGGCEHQRVERMWERWRGGEALGALLKSEGLVLQLGGLVPVARWVTPRPQPIRFDARFYVMALPVGQVGSNNLAESLEGCWSRPAKILERFERSEVEVLPPTQWMLNMLSKYEMIDDIFAFAERQTLKTIYPEFSSRGSKVCLVLPGDPEHSDAVRCLEGPTSYDFTAGRFVLNLKY